MVIIAAALGGAVGGKKKKQMATVQHVPTTQTTTDGAVHTAIPTAFSSQTSIGPTVIVIPTSFVRPSTSAAAGSETLT